ncbi:hypothetical protein FA13DRAFT_1770016 [Coprinellus micaceus]|uniref:Uncharacterized protein n=1 Tax=Coprinellus micaceus TaxID=71717 RepID=A0A4Y7TXN0_COPMI|nr:hypothetical protein FA13DRAFT_1770016 [Coprinellus micaceus]
MAYFRSRRNSAAGPSIQNHHNDHLSPSTAEEMRGFTPERKSSKNSGGGGSFWSRKSLKRSSTTQSTSPVVQPPPPTLPSDAQYGPEFGVDEDGLQVPFGSISKLSHSRSLNPESIHGTPMSNDPLAELPQPGFKVKYHLHNPLGPRWYKNYHLIPPAEKQPSARPPTFFSTSFPPISTSSTPDNIHESGAASKRASVSPQATPASSQTRIGDGIKPRSRKTSQTAPDNVDLMDVTDPWGSTWHHDSPYDILAPVSTKLELDSRTTGKLASAPPTPIDRIYLSDSVAPESLPKRMSVAPPVTHPFPSQPQLTPKKEKRSSFVGRIAKKFSLFRRSEDFLASKSREYSWLHVNPEDHASMKRQSFDHASSHPPSERVGPPKRVAPPSMAQEPQPSPPPEKDDPPTLPPPSPPFSYVSFEAPFSIGKLTVANPDFDPDTGSPIQKPPQLQRDFSVSNSLSPPPSIPREPSPPPGMLTVQNPTLERTSSHYDKPLPIPAPSTAGSTLGLSTPTAAAEKHLDQEHADPISLSRRATVLSATSQKTATPTAPQLPRTTAASVADSDSDSDTDSSDSDSDSSSDSDEGKGTSDVSTKPVPPDSTVNAGTSTISAAPTLPAKDKPPAMPTPAPTPPPPTPAAATAILTPSRSKSPAHAPETLPLLRVGSHVSPANNRLSKVPPEGAALGLPVASVISGVTAGVFVPLSPEEVTSQDRINSYLSYTDSPCSATSVLANPPTPFHSALPIDMDPPAPPPLPAKGAREPSKEKESKKQSPSSTPQTDSRPETFKPARNHSPENQEATVGAGQQWERVNGDARVATKTRSSRDDDRHRRESSYRKDSSQPATSSSSSRQHTQDEQHQRGSERHSKMPQQPNVSSIPMPKMPSTSMTRRLPGNTKRVHRRHRRETTRPRGGGPSYARSGNERKRRRRHAPRRGDDGKSGEDRRKRGGMKKSRGNGKGRGRGKKERARRRREREKEEQREREKEREREARRQQRELERERERERERLERERQEWERMERERERERQQRELELQLQIQRHLEMEERERERQRLKELEKERERERERIRELERDRERERERVRELEREKERLKQVDKEREMERHRLLESEREKERLRELERERARELERERERLRQFELEREKERLRQVELEREKEKEREKERKRKERRKAEKSKRASRRSEDDRRDKSKSVYHTPDQSRTESYYANATHSIYLGADSEGRVERKPSTAATRPTSELPSAADMNALRAKDAWDMERMWRARSMYGAEMSGNAVQSIPTQSVLSFSDNLSSQGASYGSSYTAFSLQAPFQGHPGSSMYHSMPTKPPPIMYGSPASIPSLPDSTLYDPYDHNNIGNIAPPPPPRQHRSSHHGPSPPILSRSPLTKNPLPEPPRESTYQPAPLPPVKPATAMVRTSDYWAKYAGVTTNA